MQTIEQTVETALTEAGNGSYLSYAAPVIAALKARDAEIAEALVSFASDKGADVHEVESLLQEVTLVATPEPEPVVVQSNDEAAPGWAQGIIDRLNRLEGVARSRGLL